jgi:N-acyl-D-amino-acid deacylase
MRPFGRLPVLATAALALLAFRDIPAQGAVAARPTLITHVMLFDGTGSPARAASVRIGTDGKIAAVGNLTAMTGENVLDGGGLALTPGFIDTHSHHGITCASDGLVILSQGVTTDIAGQDGDGSIISLIPQMTGPAATNVATYAGHGPIRSAAMNPAVVGGRGGPGGAAGAPFDCNAPGGGRGRGGRGRAAASPATKLPDPTQRHATPAEIAKMQELLRREMEAGALGLSSGLEYDPGIYSDRAEMLAVAKVAGDMGGRYISHIRSEDRWEWDAIDEIIEIGRINRMPVQISHMKLGMKSWWGMADSLIKLLNKARAGGVNITADIYPYTHWSSGLSVLFPSRDGAPRDCQNRKEATFALAEVSPPEGITLQSGEYRGKTIAQVAKEMGVSPVDALLKVVGDCSGGGIIAQGMIEPDVEKLMAWPYSNISSDGSNGGHPRGWGTFPRVLGVYVRQRHVMTFAEAIRKMTSLAADNVGIRNRGRVVVGAHADLVLLDTATVIDRATFEQPTLQSEGISKVWVNGVL